VPGLLFAKVGECGGISGHLRLQGLRDIPRNRWLRPTADLAVDVHFVLGLRDTPTLPLRMFQMTTMGREFASPEQIGRANGLEATTRSSTA
jgi:hypothetical protein